MERGKKEDLEKRVAFRNELKERERERERGGQRDGVGKRKKRRIC